MRAMTIGLCLGAVVVGLALDSPPAQAVEVGMREGEAFPDFALPRLAGGKLQAISSFRGKKVLLLVFASW